MKKNILIGLMILAGHLALGQSTQERYLNAKELFRSGKYGLASEAFQPLTIGSSQNPFAEYASFFYALSSYHEGYAPYARDLFLQLKERFPQWEKMDEVNYWLAKIYFEEGKYGRAFEALDLVRDDGVKEDAKNMKYHFLSRMNSLDSLEGFLSERPEDKLLARVTAEKIAERPLAVRNVDRLAELVDKHELDRAKFEINRPEKSIKKEEYNIGVIMPFLFREFSKASSTGRKNFVYEIYEGMKMARDELNRKGYRINLFAYDSRRDSLYVKSLLEKDELKGMDMIVGPLSFETVDVVSSFSYENQINMVNPVSTNSMIIGYNPYSFLFLSSLETQAVQTADFVDRRFRDNPNALVFYGESSRDSTLAAMYKQAIEEKGFNVRHFRRFDKENSKEVFEMLTRLYEETDELTDLDPDMPERTGYVIPRDSIGHIFVASDSDDGMIAANLISAIETRGDRPNIVGSEEWLDYSFVIPEQLERLQVYLIAPSFIDFSTDNYQEFRRGYLDRTYTLPSKYASLGYDMMMLFGDLLHEYGVYYQLEFDQIGFRQGILLPGYKYDGAQDNQYVPIIRFEESELVNVNQSED